MKRYMLATVPVLLAMMLTCPGVATSSILVISPHPDDDVLTAAGVVYNALATGESAEVVYMTNGDLSGVQQGLLRQTEAVMGQVAHLGMIEDDLIFLGYPDGHLREIYLTATNQNDVFTTPSGQSTTYGNRGLGRTDYHTYRFGSPASYNRYNILTDLEEIILYYRPEHIFTICEFDPHTDHSTTYLLLTQALLSVRITDPTYSPTVHKTFVNAPDGSNDWPSAMDAAAYYSEVPGLSETGLNWDQRESIDVPLLMQSTTYLLNPKYLAISEHASQGGASGALSRFIHKDELFWAESTSEDNEPPHINAGVDQAAAGGVVVQLDGSGSSDPDGDALTFQWVQTDGTPVQLSDQGAVRPSFTAPMGLAADEVLTFELTVSDGRLTSIPDSVNITVLADQPYTNVAPLAAVSASSETPLFGQLATKAVDGVVDGYPGDHTREWATRGERTGAWIRLTWGSSYEVDRVVLYDRPNTSDYIQGGTLTFSDGTSLSVGPLNNNGTGVEYRFSPKVITGLTLTVTAVGSSTGNVGLSEIEVYGRAGVVGNRSPHANAGVDQAVAGGVVVQLDGSGSSDPDADPLTFQWVQTLGTPVQLSDQSAARPHFTAPTGLASDEVLTFQLTVSDGRLTSTADSVNIMVSAGNHSPHANAGVDQSVTEGALVQLNGSGSSDPDGDALTFQWVQTDGTPVQLSDPAAVRPSFAAPTGLASDEVLTFRLTVSDGRLTSTADTVSITVVSAQPADTNVAPLAAVSASSETPFFGQLATKAVDGVVDGYPGDHTREWATRGERTGAWIRLRWGSSYEVDRVVLYDRPNTSDYIQGGTLTFSDGTSLSVGPLNNNGTGVEYRFTPKVITELTFTVTAVGSRTGNVGLAEIEVYGRAGVVGNRSPHANAGVDQAVAGGVVVQLDGSGSSDPDGDPLTFQWVQTLGTPVQLSDEGAARPSFTAPTGLASDEVLTFQLTVSDGRLTSTADSVNITVSAGNHSPHANAGVDQVVAGGVVVQLDGSGSSDPDADPLTFQWVQTLGTPVQLSDEGAARPSFTSPTGSAADEVLTFRLTVSDGRLTSTADSVNIMVSGGNHSPHANAGVDQSVAEGVLVQLNGSGSSDPDGDALTFQWVQTDGTPVQLSDPAAASPSFTAPTGLASDEMLTFRLTVSDGRLISTADTVSITVVSAQPADTNVAPLAAVSASSETPFFGQLATKAVDGVVDGYPGDHTREWATRGERTGAWIRLTWGSSYEVDRVVLYDRPNTSDYIQGGTLMFSDGTSLSVGPLNNNGTGVEYQFPSKVITELTFTVTAVGSRTQNVGLSEIEVYGR